MKRKKDRSYSAEHVIQRLLERYGMQITEQEYTKLCGLVAREVAMGRAVQEPNGDDPQFMAKIAFKDQKITAVWSARDQRVRTVLPRNQI